MSIDIEILEATDEEKQKLVDWHCELIIREPLTTDDAISLAFKSTDELEHICAQLDK